MTLGDFESAGRSLFTREVLRGGNSDAVSALQFVNMGYRKSPFISGLIIIIINYTQLCYILGPTESVHWGLTHPGQYQRLNYLLILLVSRAPFEDVRTSGNSLVPMWMGGSVQSWRDFFCMQWLGGMVHEFWDLFQWWDKIQSRPVPRFLDYPRLVIRVVLL